MPSGNPKPKPGIYHNLNPGRCGAHAPKLVSFSSRPAEGVAENKPAENLKFFFIKKSQAWLERGGDLTLHIQHPHFSQKIQYYRHVPHYQCFPHCRHFPRFQYHLYCRHLHRYLAISLNASPSLRDFSMYFRSSSVRCFWLSGIYLLIEPPSTAVRR